MRKYKNKSNICGNVIKKYREEQGLSRENLAIEMQLLGVNIDRTHLFRMEKGEVILKDF